MQHINEHLLATSLDDRVAYLTSFLDFGPTDVAAIAKVAPHLGPLVPSLIDGVYEKLFQFDVTKQVFLNRNTGFRGELPATLEELTTESPQIKFRKSFLQTWAARATNPREYQSGSIWKYMDRVGLMHTGVYASKSQEKSGRPPLFVTFRDCSALLGWVESALAVGVLSLPDDQLLPEDKAAAVLALNKVIWIQADLFSRHYMPDESTPAPGTGVYGAPYLLRLQAPLLWTLTAVAVALSLWMLLSLSSRL